jgi:KipI family sensor histidine kinase inhibitor
LSSAHSIRQAGDRAVLIELADNDAVQMLASGLEPLRGAELAEIVPGHETLLVVWNSKLPSLQRVEEIVGGAYAVTEAIEAPSEVTLAVRYDGPDLAAVAEICGVSAEEVVARHLAAQYRVGFIGFAPGFAYLLGGDPALQPPRLAEPRTRVPAGALAIAGPYSAVYPRSSPGGWNLVGSCEEPIFDVERTPPALLTPGTLVRLVAQ